MEQYLNQVNRIDSIISVCEDSDALFVCDEKGYVAYCRCPLNYFFTPEEIFGKHVFEIFPLITAETSPVMQVLKNGESIINNLVETVTYQGQKLVVLTTAMPILVSGEVIGAIDSFKFYQTDHIWDAARTKTTVHSLQDVVGQTPVMQSLVARVQEAALTSSPALFYGEIGTGKALLANCLHSEGPRAEEPFLWQNCAALPPHILAAVLFGTERGCYTGAEQRKGLIEAAHGGTLYLSHIDALDLSLQSKLLNVLKEKKLRRLGGVEEYPFDTRIVCSICKNPRTCLLEKRLLDELYAYISAVKLAVPPLRERLGDVLPLAQHFIACFNSEFGRDIKSVSSLSEGLLQAYSWSGNIQELRNSIENAFRTAKGDCILVDDLEDILAPGGGPRQFQAATPPLPGGFSLTAALEIYERDLIRQALSQTASVAEAARLLGLSRQLLQYKLQKFEL